MSRFNLVQMMLPILVLVTVPCHSTPIDSRQEHLLIPGARSTADQMLNANPLNHSVESNWSVGARTTPWALSGSALGIERDQLKHGHAQLYVAISARCNRPGDPPPAVASESSSLLLLGLGMAVVFASKRVRRSLVTSTGVGHA